MTTAAATKPHTALDRVRAGIVVVCAIRRRTASGDHTVALTKIIKVERLIKSKPFPEDNGGQKSERKLNDVKGSSEGGEDMFPGCRKEIGLRRSGSMGQAVLLPVLNCGRLTDY
jgi:hypothetical protein